MTPSVYLKSSRQSGMVSWVPPTCVMNHLKEISGWSLTLRHLYLVARLKHLQTDYFLPWKITLKLHSYRLQNALLFNQLSNTVPRFFVHTSCFCLKSISSVYLCCRTYWAWVTLPVTVKMTILDTKLIDPLHTSMVEERQPIVKVC